MSRLSQGKIVTDTKKHSSLLDKYNAVIEKLEKKFTVADGNGFSELVNFKANKIAPKHNWYDYKQGYAGELVKAIIESENPSRDYFILDPFAGVGTTNLVAQMLGYKSIGFDINPVALLAAKTKTVFYEKKDIATIKKILTNFNPSIESPIRVNPKVIISSFTKRALSNLYKIKYQCEQIEKSHNEKISNFFWLSFLSIIEDCSIRTKDGNGIKLNKKKKPIDNIFLFFKLKSNSMLKDIEHSNYANEAKFILGSLLRDDHTKNLQDNSVSMSIFSPPYANCFDYCEVYKLEFWMGSFVKDYEGFKFYRDMAMRSHVNSTFDHRIKNFNSDVDNISDTIATFNIWNKNIPDMIRGYFDDMSQLLLRMKRTLIKGAACYIVVANSGYKGILVPSDLLIADIASNMGYKVEKILLARKIRASSQQMNELHGRYNNLMRESIIKLRKP